MKVNVLSLLSLSLIGTFSASSYAVEGGTSLTWSEHPYLVESQCSGTVLAGKYILFAGHCAASVDSPFPREVNLSNGKSVMPTERNAEPYDNVDGIWDGGADVALWTLPDTAPMDKVIFIADLNDNASIVGLHDEVSFMGFGQDDYVPRLGQAFNQVTKLYPSIIIYSDTINSIAYSVPGDSGAPVLNTANRVVAVNYSADGQANGEQNGVNLRYVKTWLLESLDRWHSATELKFTGDKTIEVQSLHVNNVDMSLRQNTNELTTGDVMVTGGSCLDGAVKPFGICTLELSSAGGEGKVVLENGNEITINRAVIAPPTPTPNEDSGSGGSLSAFSIFALLALSLGRKLAPKFMR